MLLEEKLCKFYSFLLDGNEEELLSLFSDVPRVNTPFEGEVKGREAFADFVTGMKNWLQKQRAKPEVFALTATEQRICIEFVLYLESAGRSIDLPVALVADCSKANISTIRVYHSTWPFTGKHLVRPPLLSPEENLDEPAIIIQYTEALHRGDANAVLALFEENGYVREPSGSKFKHSGKKGQKEFYTSALKAGGISLKHCTSTFNGTRTAVEYICNGWGNSELEPQAGAAVYELGNSGLLFAARIYDDVSPPDESI